jgi:hypothetical protein
METQNYCSSLCEIHARYGKAHALDILGALNWYHKLLVEAWDATSAYEGERNEREKQEADIYLPRRWFIEVDELLNRNSAITESKTEEEKPVGYKFGLGRYKDGFDRDVTIVAELPPELAIGAPEKHTLIGVVESAAGDDRFISTYHTDGTTFVDRRWSDDALVPPVTQRWRVITTDGIAEFWRGTREQALKQVESDGRKAAFLLSADIDHDGFVVPNSAKVHPV